MRKFARIDENQKEIVNELRKLGYSVLVMSQLGNGAPDISVGKNNKNLFFEIKDGNKIPSKQRLTIAEEKFRDEWQGHYAVINSIEAALKEIRKFN